MLSPKASAPAFAAAYAENPGPWIAFVHGVTAPRSLRTLAPHLDPGDLATAWTYGWHAVAALYAGFGTTAPVSGAIDAPATNGNWDELVDAAIANGDDHVIKLTVAAREEATVDGGDDALLRATAASLLG